MNLKLGLTLFVLALAQPVGAAPIDDPTDPDPEPEETPAQICQGQIDYKRETLAAAGIDLGARVGTLRVHFNQWCSQAYANGRIHSAAPIGGATAVILAPVLAKYSSLGNESFGRAFGDAFVDASGATRQTFGGGVIIAHPSFGTRAIQQPLSGLWAQNGGTARMGYPTTDQLANPFGLGSYSMFERGYAAQTTDFGSWIDYTAGAEGRVSAAITMYAEAGFWGTSLARSFAGESPVALRPQMGALDENSSSFIVSMPTRTSLYLFADSPLEGSHVRISGADNASVRISNIGTFMNDRTSSMLFVNHGTASARMTLESLRTQIETSLNAMDTSSLIRSALAGHDASGSLTWNSPVTVELLAGERLIKFSRRAYMDINAGCVGIFNCNADGTVEFVIYVRPSLAGEFRAQVSFVEGQAVSISCSGWACDERSSALDGLFDSSTVRRTVEDAFNASLATSFASLPVLANLCPGISARRVNVTPTFVEVVVADTAAQASCAAPFAGSQLDFNRPVGRVENSNGTVITSGVTVVPNLVIYPPIVKGK